MYLHRSIIDPEPDDRLRRHRLRPVTISVDTSHFPTSALSHSNASFMRFQKRIQTASLTSWQIALIVIGALIFIAIIYALYIIYQLRRSKQTGQYSTGTSFFGLLSTRRPAGRRRGSSTSRRRDGRSKRRRGSAHLSSADSGVAGVAIGGRDDDDKEMDSPVKMSRLLNGTPSQAAHRSPVGASPSTIAMMHYHHNDGEEEEISPPPPPTGSTLRPSTGFTSSSSITHTSFPAPYAKDGASLHEAASIKECASIKERAPESTSPSVGSPIISSPLHSLLGDPLSTSAKSTGGFSLGNTLSAALDKHRQRRGSKSSTNTTPTPSLLQTGSALASSPPHSGSIISGRPRSQTQSHSQTKSPRPRSRASRSQTRTLDDGQHHGSPPTSAGGPSSPLSPSSLGASLGLFGRHHSSSTHSHSAQTTSQQSKSHHGPRHQLSKEDGLRGRETEREREFDFDDRDSIAHTIRESFGDDNDYSRIEGEMETEMDEQVSTSFTTQSGTGSASGTSNAHTYSGEVTPRGASVPRISSPRASTKRLGSSHSTASHGYGTHSFTPPTTAMSRTTFAENGVAVPFSGIGLAFGRAGRDTSDTERESKRAEKDKERSRRRRGERNEEYG